jgi:ATP synthase protein I
MKNQEEQKPGPDIERDNVQKAEDAAKSDRKDILKALTLFSQLGFSMAACVLIGFLAGKYLDVFFGSSPWLLIVFSIIGMCASFRVLYDLTIKAWL